MAKKSNTTPAAATATDPLTDNIESAFAVGNYAAVRTLARKAEASGSPSAIHRAHQKLALINVDILQVLAGLLAMTVTAIIAFLTLGH
jgi:hypothetical protein